jgi:hypothetical protein
MFDNPELDQQIRAAVVRLMAALYEQGLTEIHMGGLLRLLGVSNDIASKHDDDRVALDQEFVDYVKKLNQPRPKNQRLH